MAFEEYCRSHTVKLAVLALKMSQNNRRLESNQLRLHIMGKINEGTSFHRSYYNAAKHIIHFLCGNELVIQKDPDCPEFAKES